jgi:CBS domain containing-hemolysin-like protein
VTELLLLAVAFGLVVACGGFVAAEFAFVTVDRATVDRAAEQGDRSAQGVQRALRSLSTQLSGAQVGITITNLAIGFLAEPAIARLIDGPLAAAGVPESRVPAIAVGTGLVLATGVTMILGELVPKNLAIAHPLGTARATQAFQRGFTAAMAVPIRGLNGSANWLVRRLGVEPQEELRSARTSRELASLIRRSADEGLLDEKTAGLMQRSVDFGERTAGEIMTPRVRMVAVDALDPAIKVLELARSSGHSRFPVVTNDADDVVGAVHVKHVVALPREQRGSRRVRDVMVKATAVPSSLRLDPLLAQLRHEGFQLATVIDEYGGTAGIVTLEDVVEEIVGEIRDEHDPLAASVRRDRDGAWVVSGLLRPDEVEESTGVRLPESNDYDTVAGMFLSLHGAIPGVGDAVEVELEESLDEHGDPLPREVATVTVDRMAGLRVDRLRILTREVAEDE